MVEIRPLNQYPQAVYIDGLPLKKQLIDGLTITGNQVFVWCYTDKRLSEKETPEDVKYCVSFKTEPGTQSSLERTLFIFDLS